MEFLLPLLLICKHRTHAVLLTPLFVAVDKLSTQASFYCRSRLLCIIVCTVGGGGQEEDTQFLTIYVKRKSVRDRLSESF